MKKTPERIEKLAAEYVIGTLTGRARRRFERWMMESWQVRQEVWFWETHLASLLEDIPEVTPSDDAWRRIETRLGWRSTSPRPSTFAWMLTLVSSTVAATLALVLVLQPTPQSPADHSMVAVVSDQAQPLWVMDGVADGRQLRTRALAAGTAGPDKDYELWILPSSGAPLSLGVLPADGSRVVIELSQTQRKALLGSKKLAISLEPRGGSPTGQPTGPVLYTTELLSL